MAYGHKTEHRLRQRAQVVLYAARGRSNARIARETGLQVETVRTWRDRFAGNRLPALSDRKRSGRPASFAPLQRAKVKALACQLPAESGTPLSRRSASELAGEVIARAIVDTISASTVRRWLVQDAIKPWQHRSWIFISDPGFRLKAARVLALYTRAWDGEPLGADEYVISTDEKTSIQARCRCHPTPRPRAGQGGAGQPHLRARRSTGLPGRLRRPPDQGVRPLRADHRHRPVHEPGHPGHEPRTLRQRETRVLDRRQRLLPPRQGRSSPADHWVLERGTGSTPPCAPLG
ncbi:helix-turn-helix domain-containing protein [Streptomyces sp. NPDC001761]